MICTYFIWFILLSFGGWVFETIFCTIRKHSWQNRGFLYGPLCPIYGVGGIAIILVYRVLLDSGIQLTWWQVFLLSCFGSMPLEYFTHWALEKLFHAYWWDYSHMPLNLHGRICLPASLLFGVFGVVIVFVAYPLLVDMNNVLPAWSKEVISLVVMLLLGADIALTVSALSQFYSIIMRVETQANAQMEQLVGNAFEAGHNFVEDRKAEITRLREEQLSHASSSVRSVIQRVKGFRTPSVHIDRESFDALRIHLKSKQGEPKK